jgi:hypothetical protein
MPQMVFWGITNSIMVNKLWLILPSAVTIVVLTAWQFVCFTTCFDICFNFHCVSPNLSEIW